ncbi:hypothetical protein [Cohnella sp. AR92]|uniref:hypothetical protein n=1 Tax=Cohnella sp. AR92 TaxID=648716 RepID=UPI000F8DC0F0|nr:hypothetical protein [Cohnella sp. AR92]RUS42227.1 hypothetical protein ELR57_27210 [Cohnella sp. AR92]
MDMYHLCLSHMNRRVRVHTHYGCIEGVVVDVDRDNLYLRPGGELTLSAWGPGFGYGWGAGGILALSLFTLLAIALI